MSYVGNKDFSNVIHTLINKLPKSNRYFSLFYGAGGLEKSIYTEAIYFSCAEINPDNKKYEIPLRAGIDYNDYRVLIAENNFDICDFIFADPPYLFSTRKSGRKYYKYEFDEAAHIEFLNYMISLPCRIMITHPDCKLYRDFLKGWSTYELNYMTHAGMYEDMIWCNYNPSSLELMNYNALGSDFTDRQRIKRQRKNIVEKFKRLDYHVKMAVIEELRNQKLI